MMLSRNIRLITYRSTTMFQQRRNSKQMSLTFAGANATFYVKNNARQIDVPTFSGCFGILAEHVPTIAVLKPGLVKVIESSGKAKVFFVSSGTVAVLADASVQVLAEEAWELKDLDASSCQQLIGKYAAKRSLATTERDRAKAEIAILCASAMHQALQTTHLD